MRNINNYQKAYREANKEKLKANQKAYREANKEKVRQYTENYVAKRRIKSIASRMNAVELPLPDKLLESLDVPLNEDQKLYLLGHLKEKRTVLAKKIGIMKLQLCYKLEKLERTGSL